MNSLPKRNRRHNSGSINSATNKRSLRTFPPERYAVPSCQPGGLVSVQCKLKSPAAGENNAATAHKPMPTKLLLNVNIERSIGPVQVVMSPDNTASDLIKSAIEIYVKEKRRPLLKETDPNSFELHYSPFSLESLKEEEKLINLGSRNFFVCSKPSTSSCSKEANMVINWTFPFTKLMEFLL